MSSVMAFGRARRDDVFTDSDDGYGFWYSDTGRIIRWALFGGLAVLVMLYLLLGYLHAKSRIRKGLAPLAYHRFLLNRRERAEFDPSYRDPVPNYSVYRPDEYGLHAYPPPVYDPNAPAPPLYQPPVGASKIDPSQRAAEPVNRASGSGDSAPEYTPPTGPPPSATLHTNLTGSSSTSTNPYRP